MKCVGACRWEPVGADCSGGSVIGKLAGHSDRGRELTARAPFGAPEAVGLGYEFAQL